MRQQQICHHLQNKCCPFMTRVIKVVLHLLNQRSKLTITKVFGQDKPENFSKSLFKSFQTTTKMVGSTLSLKYFNSFLSVHLEHTSVPDAGMYDPY